MTEPARNFWVGGFVVVSLIVLATLMAWFGETPEWLGGNEWTLNVIGVRELRGVQTGSPVYFDGVEIGRVKDLKFVDQERPDHGVTIVARIKDQYTIPRGAIARVYGATLGIGTGHIAVHVEEGAAEYLPLPREDAQIEGEMRSMIGEIITKDMVDSWQRMINNVGDFTRAATPVADNLAALLESRTVAQIDDPNTTMTANVATMIERIDRLVANVNKVLGDPDVQGDVKTAIYDFKAATAELRVLVEQWKSSTQRIADNLDSGLDRSFANLNEVLDNLDESSNSLAAILQTVAEGRGTAGLLVRDERLYEAAVLSIQRFGEAVATAQRILSAFERDGAIRIGTATSGPFVKEFPIPSQERESKDSVDPPPPSGALRP